MSILDPAGASGDLAVIAADLDTASGPEAVFGAPHGTPAEQFDQLRRRYWQLALLVHPDRHGDAPLANRAFKTLQRLYLAAQAQIGATGHGQPISPERSVVIYTRRRAYAVGEPFATGDIATFYTCTATDRRDPAGAEIGCLLKVAANPQDNDLLANEARALRHLAVSTDGRPVPAYIPKLLETFRFQDGSGDARQVNAFPLVTTERGPLPADQFYTLQEIRAAYPHGVDPKQMAWIWRRLLIALGYAHDRAVVHGAVLPTHVLVHPEAHGLLLIDWTASVLDAPVTGAHVTAISPAYEAWYPLAVLARKPPTPAVDVEMGLRCMAYLLGGDPLTGALPPTVPAQLQTYLRGALRTAAVQADARQLYRDFADLLAALWGARRFIPFTMPARR